MADKHSTPTRLGDRQRARYLSARPGRNRGPKGGKSPDPSRLLRYVVDDLPLQAGAIVNGKPVPAGSSIKSWPLAGPLHSRRAAKRTHRRMMARHPGCYRVAWRVMVDREDERCPMPAHFPASLVLGQG